MLQLDMARVNADGTKDGRSNRLGGEKKCEECGKMFEAFRSWGRYCTNHCGSQARQRRFWAKKLEHKNQLP